MPVYRPIFYDLLNTVNIQTLFHLSDIATDKSFPFIDDKEGSSADLPLVPREPCVILHLCLCLQVLIARDEISQPSGCIDQQLLLFLLLLFCNKISKYA